MTPDKILTAAPLTYLSRTNTGVIKYIKKREGSQGEFIYTAHFIPAEYPQGFIDNKANRKTLQKQ